jgi:hypothetical protein
MLHELGFDSLPIEDAKFLFQKHVGIFDNKSLNAYFGQHELRQRAILDKTTRYQNGTVSTAQVEMYRRLIQKNGYFETLNLAEIKMVKAHANNKDLTQLIFCINPKGLVSELKINFSPPHPHSSLENVTDELRVERDYVMNPEKHGADLYLSPFKQSSEGCLIPFSLVEGVQGGDSNNVENSNNNNLKAEREKSEYPVIKYEQNSKNTYISEINPLIDKPLGIKEPDDRLRAESYLEHLQKAVEDPGLDLLVRETFKSEITEIKEKAISDAQKMPQL